MSIPSQQAGAQARPKNHVVQVALDGEEGFAQPDTFRCCPLGVQFISSRDVELYTLYRVRLPTGNGTADDFLDGEAIVVHCEQNSAPSHYRVWLFFLDLPESVRGQLHCVATDEGLLCPFCRNF